MDASLSLGTRHRLFSWTCLILLLAGCAARTTPYRPRFEPGKKQLARMGFTVQVGAFVKVENAARLTESLNSRGIDATYFLAEKGFYKVRFGNFPSRRAAVEKAGTLRAAGVIGDYYIVSPGEYAVARQGYDSPGLREEIVKTARSFIGVPYLWGGTDAEKGFDCSGLAMTVYQLNGLDLPRTSVEQAAAGMVVARDHLAKGDLVFFQTKGDKVSHVGIYVGNDTFIHAPGRGKKIRPDSLHRRYYEQCFVGGRSYLGIELPAYGRGNRRGNL